MDYTSVEDHTYATRRYRVNKKLTELINDHHMTGLATVLLGLAMFLAPAMVFGQYSGPESCLFCHEKDHETRYSDWLTSGHRSMLMTSENARNRALPLPGGYSWDDISYVVGGHGRKTLYLDSDGYFITTTEDDDGNDRPGFNQYNNQTGEWSDYHPGEVNLPYDCGSCHTTNYVESGNQDGLPGISGTFDAPGVECEQCHGNGLTMNKDTSSEACGTCHTRGDDSSVIPAMNGFIQNNGQYNELLSSPHNNVNCVTCHNPHKPAEFSIDSDCLLCHSGRVEDSYLEHSMADYGVTCIDCHMPYASLFEADAESGEGDVKTHLFYINTDEQASMFNEAGDFVKQDFEVPGKPDRMNKAAVTLDFACQRCHETADINELAKHAKNFHGRDTTVSELEYIGINPGLTGNWWGGPNRDGEGFLMEVAYSQGSLTLILSFYTNDSEGNPVWLVAVGPVASGMTSDVSVYISNGQRKWGEDFAPPVATEEFGMATFTFTGCRAGSFTLVPNEKFMGEGYTTLSYPLQRDIMTPGIQCPTFVNNAP